LISASIAERSLRWPVSRPILHQAVDELKTIEALTGHQMYTRELMGQAVMFREQGIGNRE